MPALKTIQAMFDALSAADPKGLDDALARGAAARARDSLGRGALEIALLAGASRGALECVATLIKAGADVDGLCMNPPSAPRHMIGNANPKVDISLLSFAALMHPAAAEALLAAGANPIGAPRAISPLLAAVAAKRGSLCRELLARGAGPDASVADEQGLLPLARAALRGDLECVAALAPFSDVWAIDHAGRDACLSAALAGSRECVLALFPLSDPDYSRHGRKRSDIARKEGLGEMSEFLRAMEISACEREALAATPNGPAAAKPRL